MFYTGKGWEISKARYIQRIPAQKGKQKYYRRINYTGSSMMIHDVCHAEAMGTMGQQLVSRKTLQ